MTIGSPTFGVNVTDAIFFEMLLIEHELPAEMVAQSNVPCELQLPETPVPPLFVTVALHVTDAVMTWMPFDRVAENDPPLRLPADIALPCALIVSELVTNAFKNAFEHAFVGRSSGRVSVRIEGGPGGSCSLVVSDDGVGLEISDELPTRPKLGLDLVNTFIEQIDGNMRVYVDSGTTVTVAFELPAVIEPASLL